MESKIQTRRQDRADQTRDRILHAAIQEFSVHGLAGARTSAIAAAAGVNKALLYYYFQDKEGLYHAALDTVSGEAAGSTLAVLELDCSAGERILRFALQHFDRIHAQQGFQALMQQEMVRFRTGQGHALQILVRKAFEPIFTRGLAVVEEGVRSGELCHLDFLQIMYAALGPNVFYFLSAPMVRMAAPFDPLSAAAIASRRIAAVEFLGHAIFNDRRHGARLAAAVLAAVPASALPFPERKTA